MNHRLGQRFNVGNQARTAFVQHEDDGLARLGQSLHQIALVLRQPQVCQVTRRLGIGILTDGSNDDVTRLGSLLQAAAVDQFSVEN